MALEMGKDEVWEKNQVDEYLKIANGYIIY